jgi:hypothetical protein
VAAGCIVPLIVYFFSQGWLNFLKNDCEYFRNIKKMNVQQNKHNQELLKIKEQAKQIQDSIIKGEYKGVHQDDLGLCKKVFNAEQLRLAEEKDLKN